MVRIYILPCIYFSFCYADVCAVCFPHWMFEDKDFPAADASLGALETKKEGVEWKLNHCLGQEIP